MTVGALLDNCGSMFSLTHMLGDVPEGANGIVGGSDGGGGVGGAGGCGAAVSGPASFTGLFGGTSQ